MSDELMRIQTWSDLCTHLGGQVDLTRDGDRATIRVPCKPPLSIDVAQRDVFGQPWVELTSPIGEARFSSPQSMLVDNAALAIGRLAIRRDGTVVIRHSIPLTGLRLRDLEETVHAIAKQAEKAAAQLAKHSASPD